MRRTRILVVDDEVSFTRLLKLNLEQTGEFEVRVENRAEGALASARSFVPDLILLDIVMPRMVGSEVAAGLRADSHLGTVPIVFLSAAGGEWAAEHQTAAGGLPLISKPASVDEVLEGIERELSRRPSVFRPMLPDDSLGSCRSAEPATH